MTMSTSGKRGTGKGPPKKSVAAADADEKNAAASKAAAEKEPDSKDDSSANNGDKKDAAKGDGPEVVAKPQSAGASTRDAAQKILSLALKGEWSAVEQNLKSLEKLVAGGGEDVNTVPLAGVVDLVCHCLFSGIRRSLVKTTSVEVGKFEILTR